jgi:protein-S-isoprenylcysteine O-methyltransferase Ste14
LQTTVTTALLHPRTLTYALATLYVWLAWAISWFVASAWSRRTVGRPPGLAGSAYFVPTLLGTWLLFGPEFALRLRPRLGWLGVGAWSLPPALGWLLFATTLASFAFAWWARLYLGSLWSGWITFKEGHRVVDTGPYRLVRHPIYTGIIAASVFLAIELATPAAFIGAAAMAFGWWMKARVEEGFLAGELGAAYEDYRRRTPMLVPLLGPARRSGPEPQR